MTYELYRYIFLGAAVACGIMVVVSIVLFFTLRIPKVISDLSGRTERKGIEKIRMLNEQSGDKSYQSSAVNLERGKLTDKISKSGRVVPRSATPFGTGMITEKISTQSLHAYEQGEETTLLTQSNETTVLNNVMAAAAVENVPVQQPAPFQIEYEITFIHTNEVIA